jgi:ribose transport system permease protein
MRDKHHEGHGHFARAVVIRAVRDYGIFVAFLIFFVAVAFATPSFVSPKNFNNILTQWSPVGIMAVGETYVILAGGFDLSMTAGFALCAIVTAALATHGVAPAVSLSAAVAVGLAVGLVNGLIVAGLRINPFIATLGSGFVLSGVPYLLVERTYIMVRQPGFDALGTGGLFGVSNPAICLVVFIAVAGVVLSKTPYGQSVYAVGGNAEVSRLFGIRVRLVSASTYIVSGLCMGAAAALSTSRLSYSASDQDPSLLFDVIVAVIIGGTSLRGGFGSIWRTALGLAILATLQNGLNLLQINTVAQYIVKGFIIIAALAFDAWCRSFDAAPNRRRWLAEVAPIGADASLAGTTSPTTAGGTGTAR